MHARYKIAIFLFGMTAGNLTDPLTMPHVPGPVDHYIGEGLKEGKIEPKRKKRRMRKANIAKAGDPASYARFAYARANPTISKKIMHYYIYQYLMYFVYNVVALKLIPSEDTDNTSLEAQVARIAKRYNANSAKLTITGGAEGECSWSKEAEESAAQNGKSHYGGCLSVPKDVGFDSVLEIIWLSASVCIGILVGLISHQTRCLGSQSIITGEEDVKNLIRDQMIDTAFDKDPSYYSSLGVERLLAGIKEAPEAIVGYMNAVYNARLQFANLMTCLLFKMLFTLKSAFTYGVKGYNCDTGSTCSKLQSAFHGFTYGLERHQHFLQYAIFFLLLFLIYQAKQKKIENKARTAQAKRIQVERKVEDKVLCMQTILREGKREEAVQSIKESYASLSELNKDAELQHEYSLGAVAIPSMGVFFLRGLWEFFRKPQEQGNPNYRSKEWNCGNLSKNGSWAFPERRHALSKVGEEMAVVTVTGSALSAFLKATHNLNGLRKQCQSTLKYVAIADSAEEGEVELYKPKKGSGLSVNIKQSHYYTHPDCKKLEEHLVNEMTASTSYDFDKESFNGATR